MEPWSKYISPVNTKHFANKLWMSNVILIQKCFFGPFQCVENLKTYNEFALPPTGYNIFMYWKCSVAINQHSFDPLATKEIHEVYLWWITHHFLIRWSCWTTDFRSNITNCFKLVFTLLCCQQHIKTGATYPIKHKVLLCLALCGGYLISQLWVMWFPYLPIMVRVVSLTLRWLSISPIRMYRICFLW